MTLTAATLAFVRRPADESGNRDEPLQLDEGKAIPADVELDDGHVAWLTAAGVLVDEPTSGSPAKRSKA